MSKWILVDKEKPHYLEKVVIAILYQKGQDYFYGMKCARYQRGCWVDNGVRLTNLSKQVTHFKRIKSPIEGVFPYQCLKK